MKSRINMGSRPGDALSMWAVYETVQSGKRRYCAKQYAVDPSGRSFMVTMLVTDQLFELRQELARRGLACPERGRTDERHPQMVEVWL